MKQLILFLTIISVAKSKVDILEEINFEFNQTSAKINSILSRFQNSIRFGEKDTLGSKYVKEAVSFFNKTERYSEFLKYYDVSACSHSTPKNVTSYVKRHILHGLLTDHNVPDTHWHEYKLVFNKSYFNEGHEKAALASWRDNLKLVADHNQEFMAGARPYALHLNHFGDMSVEEYLKKVLKLIKAKALHDPAQDHSKRAFHKTLAEKIPDSFDWRSRGFRPRLEEQWRCGACYAFAVTHALQAQLYKKHRDWRELSPQQIVDCSGSDGNYGCGGGSLQATLRYAAREGLEMEADYPYAGKKGRCRYNSLRVKARATRWAVLPAGDERALQRALATIGPLAVAVDASPRSFQLYRTGVYDDPVCSPSKVNHAVVLVGYTPQYWIMLNWWGRMWGEEGYMRIRRGVNRCGVASLAAYVEIL